MLITRSGFKAFNKYDLSATLEAQLKRLREEVQSYIKSGDTQEIPALVGKYKITPLIFDTQNLTVTVTTARIPAEYFPNSFFVEAGKSYPKEVLIFHLPITGDQNLLHTVPSVRILWTEEIVLENNEVVFELIKFTDDVDKTRQEKDRVIDFLVQQSGNVNKQVEQYNGTINQVIIETEAQTHTQLSKQEEFLAQLGTPLKDKNTQTESPNNDRPRTSRVVDKKPKTFDVFICHASEDKDFVDQLTSTLKNDGVAVWYDSFQIGWGDDLRPAIDNGLKNSRYGIVVFSSAFLKKKKWTEYELNGLFSKEKNGQKVILPIWHDITKDDISQYSLTFADRIAKRSDDIPSIVKEFKNLLT